MHKPISIIIPARNEAELIGAQLERLQGYREAGHEVILVDGGSSDGTPQRALGLVDSMHTSEPGRSKQMNLGAAQAKGDILLFLHVDTVLPEQATEQMLQAMGGGRRWGWFDVRLSSPRLTLRVVARMMNLRSRFTGVCTGDQALFVESDLFREIGGFPDLELMEDVAISKTLRRTGAAARPHAQAIASSRRWEKKGVVVTVMLMWKLRFYYFLGMSPARLARMYYPRHD